jgi:small GTP-binding protein
MQYNTLNNTTYKIVLLGDGCIGKSTFFHKLSTLNSSDYQFPKNYNATDNFDFNRITLKSGNQDIVIDLWDTAGQEKNKGGLLRDAYLKGADGVLLLYDISENSTITNLPKWLVQIKNVCGKIPVAVIGNKCDKFANLQQSESVKLRECNLVRDIGHRNIKNFLISIKENTHIIESTSYWSSLVNYKEGNGCMIGLEYILSSLMNKTIVL